MQEQFSYSLMASGLGILIVFLILVLLSALMIVIRKFSDGDGSAKKKQPASAAVKTAPTSSAQETNDWILAAVAAFLAVEDDEQIVPQAGSWSPSDAEKVDPWVNATKLSKTVPGA